MSLLLPALIIKNPSQKNKSMKRESGFYWVKFAEEWIIAEWYEPGQYWYIPGSIVRNPERSMTEIDERRILKD